ncbi:hypothetical protein [Amycolatopsis pigmentata]|uniref:Serine/threonine protein kinase n=1 Tax=Amycolatopsis pigmentata TaxID=450801 RepID=A0ABW5G588_9PSEU
MTHSGPRSGPPAREETPPREPLSRVHRGGYLMLAASGVVLATAFGGIAQLLSPHAPSTDIPAGNRNPGSQQVVPADDLPGTLPATSGGQTKHTSSSPTTSVTIGPDGQRTTAILPPAGSAPVSVSSMPQGGGHLPPPTTSSKSIPPPKSSESSPSSPPPSSPTTTTTTTGSSGGGTGTSG